MTGKKDKVSRLFNEALKRYALISDGDRILVGLSGGKDSMALLELLAHRQRIFVPRFEVEAAYVRMTDIPYQCDEEYLRTFAQSLGVPLHIVETQAESEEVKNESEKVGVKKGVCFCCSRHRRNSLFAIAKRLQCNKIALGHHRDDLIVTAIMNLTFEGQFATMRPLMVMDHFPMTLIRPLCLVREADLVQWAADHHYREQLKRCPYDQATRRHDIKGIAAQLEHLNPEFSYTFYRAMERTFTNKE